MRKFDFKQLGILFLILFPGGALNNYLFKHRFFGEVDGPILTIGAMSFFFACLGLTIFMFQLSFIVQLFRKQKPINSREELYERERQSRLNWLGVVSGIIVGFIFGLVFAIFYKDISLGEGIRTMMGHGIGFGLVMLILVRMDWFSYFAFAKDESTF